MLQNRKLTFSEKEVASLFKNGHFKNVQFRKTPTQIYIMFLLKFPHLWGICIITGVLYIAMKNWLE